MRDYTKFYTPPEKSAELVALAQPLVGGMKILEPSFGSGNIIKASKKSAPNVHVTGYELQLEPYNLLVSQVTTNFKVNPHQNSSTANFPTLNLLLHNLDFLSTVIREKYDRIIANPPFDGDKWIGHLIKMYYLLSARGRLVCIIPRKFVLTHENTAPFIISYFADKIDKWIEIDNWATNNDGTTTQIDIIVIQR